MAKIVMGIGSSHGPMLSTPPEEWGQRVIADQRSNELWYQGRQMSFGELVEARSGEDLAKQVTPEKMRKRFDACQVAIANLAAEFARVAPDVAVIVGDDQEEVYFDYNMPAMSVYWGDTVDNIPPTPEQAAKMPPGIAIALSGHTPPEPTKTPGEPKLGRHLIESLIDQEFDVSHSRVLPLNRHGNRSIPHAYGFVYRRIMNDQVIPNVPVFINTFYPPNQPSLRRSYELGKALRKGIESWDSDARVAVIASGGLTHFVVEEDLDEMVLKAMEGKDDVTLTNLPVERFNSGTSEIRNWIATAGAMDGTDLEYKLIDYVPCYRSLAGTGNAMGFAFWS